MKITICGSMHFAKEMLEVQKILEEAGHDILIPFNTKECIDNPRLSENYEFVCKNDALMDHFNKVKRCDAILVLNYSKNNINGYIGGSTLMEIGLAKYLGKKIFILHELPSEEIIKYIFEVKITQPIILSGNINNLDKYI